MPFTSFEKEARSCVSAPSRKGGVVSQYRTALREAEAVIAKRCRHSFKRRCPGCPHMNRLPTTESRTINPIFREILIPNFKKERNDTYIYYLVFIRCFYVSIAFAVLNWISLIFGKRFDLYFFDIGLPQRGGAEAFLFSYSAHVTALLLLVIVPTHLALFRNNVPATEDLLWWNSRLKHSSRKSIVVSYSWALLVILFACYFSAGLPLEILNYTGLKESKFYSLLFSVGLSYFLSVGVMYAFLSITILLHYVFNFNATERRK